MSDNVSEFDPKQQTGIRLTRAAIEHVRQSLKKRGAGIGMRIAIKTAGCSGLMYVVDFVDRAKPDDLVFQVADDVAIFVDPKSLLYINGTEVDFITEGLNARLEFNNPRVKASCGCGESFHI